MTALRIAVDVSALASAGNGISRYVGRLLELMLADQGEAQTWCLYGRGVVARPEWAPSVRVRGDGLPADIGRIGGLVSSLPLWAALDRPDVFWGPAHRLPAWLPQATARVVTIHDLCWLKAPQTMRTLGRRLDAMWMPRALREADRIIAVSEATATDLRAAFPDVRERLVVVHEGVSPLPSPAGPEALRGLGVDAPYVLFVGTLEPRKNLLRLLEACARVLPMTGGQLVIAGASGWGGLKLQEDVARTGLESRVRWLGCVSDAVLATLYSHAHCLAMPSLYEGFGLPLLEAMAHGTPVLTSNVASMPEVAGDAGLLVDPRDVDAIGDALRRLLCEPGLRARLAGQTGRQVARFSWSRAARQTLAVFDEAVMVRRERCG